MIITIQQTDDIDKDLDTLGTVLNTLECFPGNEELRLKIVDQWYEITLLALPQKVDSENVDLIELLFGIENIGVEL